MRLSLGLQWGLQLLLVTRGSGRRGSSLVPGWMKLPAVSCSVGSGTRVCFRVHNWVFRQCIYCWVCGQVWLPQGHLEGSGLFTG